VRHDPPHMANIAVESRDPAASSAERVLAYLDRHHPDALNLVIRGEPAGDLSIQDASDIVYSLALLGRTDLLTAEGAAAFATLARRWQLAGGLNTPAGQHRPASVHLTAYLLGSAALWRATGYDMSSELVGAPKWRLHELFDE